MNAKGFTEHHCSMRNFSIRYRSHELSLEGKTQMPH